MVTEEITDPRIDEPDWSVFDTHVEKFLKKGFSDYERRVSDLTLFACLPDDSKREFRNKVDFESIEYIPSCIKYKKPSSISYNVIENEFCGKTMMPIEVDIKKLIGIDHKHFLNLHPERYDNVKNAVAHGEIDTPRVLLTDEGIPRVDDGRHRITSIYKFGFDKIKVVVPVDDADTIINLLANHDPRLDKKVQNVSTSPPKRLGLEDIFGDKPVSFKT